MTSGRASTINDQMPAGMPTTNVKPSGNIEAMLAAFPQPRESNDCIRATPIKISGTTNSV